MIMISKQDWAQVTESIKAGNIDAAIGSEANLVDEVLLAMNRAGVIGGLGAHIQDKRERRGIPFHLVLTLGIAAKMKVASNLTDIPFAIRSAKTLGELGYCMWDTERELGKGLMDEGSIRKLVGKYKPEDWLDGYNGYVQRHVLPTMNIVPDIHILDVTKLEVNLDNENYEGAEVTKDTDGVVQRGYKLGTLRGISGDRGFIEEICFGSIKDHDFKLSEGMLRNTAIFKPGDIVLMDRGFIDRDVINFLKDERGVDVYIPLRNNMIAYEDAVYISKTQNIWHPHPNKKRKTQKIAFVKDAGAMWQSEHPENDVPLNACVVTKT
jgi:hypothetical protein